MVRSAIRNARAADIPGIVLLLQEQYLFTEYAREGRAAIDVPFTKSMLAQAIQRHGKTNGGGCFVQVADLNGVIVGLVLGTLVRVYAIGDKLMASDIFWLVNEQASAVDAAALMRNMIAWAKSAPHCIQVKNATTQILGSRDRGGIILQRLGFEPYGNIYAMDFRGSAQCLAS